MNRQELITQIKQKKSYLCIGLDTDIIKLPAHLLHEPDPVFSFNKAIIDTTSDLCVCYKINTAFYESQGVKGWESMQKTVDYIPANIFTIADAKRGDIGNTSLHYAKAFFETMGFDAVTVAPYMGADSIKPFLDYKDKWTIVLGLTSNPGAQDFELQKTGEEYIYEKVLKTAMQWGTTENLMFVIGATQSDQFKRARAICPDHFFLVPGVGAQGGTVEDISLQAMNIDVGLLINISRAIIYASGKDDFAQQARAAAQEFQRKMLRYL